MSKNFIKKILRESLQGILEAKETIHSGDRLNDRLDILLRTNSLTTKEVSNIKNNLKLIKGHNFPKQKSYAIKLGGFEVKKDSIYYRLSKNGEPQYSIPNPENPNIKSKGNEFWVVVRGDVISTLMLSRKSQFKNTAVAKDKLDVDEIIFNIEKYLLDSTQHKERNIKFKKIKLTNGKIIKFYPEINKFEDIRGEEINLDDILDYLSEKDSQFIFKNI